MVIKVILEQGFSTTAAISGKVGICKGNPLAPPFATMFCACCEVEEQAPGGFRLKGELFAAFSGSLYYTGSL